MRRADFGKTPTPAHSTTEGPVYGEDQEYPAVGLALQGSKPNKAGEQIRKRAVNRHVTASSGGHRDLANTHAANVGKKAYATSGDKEKPVKHDAGARPVAK